MYKLGVSANIYYIIDEEVGDVYSFNSMGVCVGEHVNMMLAKTSSKSLQEVIILSVAGYAANKECDVMIASNPHSYACIVKDKASNVIRAIENSKAIIPIIPIVLRLKRRDAPGVIQYIIPVKACAKEALEKAVSVAEWRSI